MSSVSRLGPAASAAGVRLLTLGLCATSFIVALVGLAGLVGATAALVASLRAWSIATFRILQCVDSWRDSTIWLLISTSLVYGALTTVGRLPTRTEAAFKWRYAQLVPPTLCGLLLTAKEWNGQPAHERRAQLDTCLALVATLLVWGGLVPERNGLMIAAVKRTWVATNLATRDFGIANSASGLWAYPPQGESAVIAAHLRLLNVRRPTIFRAEATLAAALAL